MSRSVKLLFRPVNKNITKFNQSFNGFSTYKSTTGLVGLNVDPNGINTLNNLSHNVLTSVKVRF